MTTRSSSRDFVPRPRRCRPAIAAGLLLGLATASQLAMSSGVRAGDLDTAEYKGEIVDPAVEAARIRDDAEAARYPAYVAKAAADLKIMKISESDEAVPAPRGWTEFCRSRPDQCERGKGQANGVAPMPAQAWRDLLAINHLVNRSVIPMTDMDHWGIDEKWSIPEPADMRGDCEDYVLLKRKMLIDAGWRIDALSVAVVRDKTNLGHAVLIVKTDIGDFVLDNERRDVVPWNESGYRFIKMQSAGNPNVWVPFDNPYKALGLFRIAAAQTGTHARGAQVFE